MTLLMRKCFARALLAASLMMVGVAARAQSQPRLAVLPLSGTNVHPGYLDAAQALLKDHLTATGRFYVVTVPGPAPDHEPSPEEAIARGRTVRADLVVITKLVHLAGTARISITALRTSDGSVAHADGMAMAGGPDDLDPVLKRLAVGLATGKPAKGNAEIDTVTQQEADPYIKQIATRTVGLRLAASLPFGRPGGSPTAVSGLGLFWLYDARDFMAEVFGDFFVSSTVQSAIFDAGIGGYYPFSRRNFTPYLGGGAAWSVSQLGGRGANGVRLHGAVGMLFGRLSTVQMRGELGYFVNLFGEKNNEGTDTAVSHGPMLTLGLGL